MRQIGIGQDDFVDLFAVHNVRQFGLGPEGDAVRVVRPGERGWVDPIVDSRYLRRGERDDSGRDIMSKDHIVVVEVTSTGTHYHDSSHIAILDSGGIVRPEALVLSA